jgi:bifunctional ADP-heptose synthase (sugar kinase/adenylyltransferase)
MGGIRAGMDTRDKIASAAAAGAQKRLTVVTGYFDPLLAWHARELERIREEGGVLAVIPLPLAGELLPLRARAELVAALRMVDYVLIAENGDWERLIAEVKPAEIVRLEEDDLCRRDELIEHVRRRQIR